MGKSLEAWVASQPQLRLQKDNKTPDASGTMMDEQGGSWKAGFLEVIEALCLRSTNRQNKLYVEIQGVGKYQKDGFMERSTSRTP